MAKDPDGLGRVLEHAADEPGDACQNAVAQVSTGATGEADGRGHVSDENGHVDFEPDEREGDEGTEPPSEGTVEGGGQASGRGRGDCGDGVAVAPGVVDRGEDGGGEAVVAHFAALADEVAEAENGDGADISWLSGVGGGAFKFLP